MNDCGKILYFIKKNNKLNIGKVVMIHEKMHL